VRYSFCIITDSQEPEKTIREIESIRAQNIPDYEILLAGDVSESLSKIVTLTLLMPDDAHAGRLGAMRNAVVKQARGEIVIVLDDDLYLHPGFYAGLMEYGDNWDVLSCRILNPDGSRYWDWKISKMGYNRLIPYDSTDPDISLTGGLLIARAWVFGRVTWDAERGFYQAEDVDFTNKLKDAGIRIAFNPYSTVTHDAAYMQIGEFVYRC
jgi:hypothetical protein